MTKLKAVENQKNLYNADANISIYVADLGAYVSGSLKGKWVSLPLAEEDLEDLYNMAEELAIHDYECDFMSISEYASIRELNDLALELEELDSIELEAFECYLKEVEEDVTKALNIIRSNDYTIYFNCDTMQDVAMEYIDMIGGVDQVANKQYYFDAEAFGRDLEIEGYNPHMSCGCYQDDCEECNEAIRMLEDGEIDFTEIAEEWLDNGLISNEDLERYFDYESFGRDIELDGYSRFVFSNSGHCYEFQ